MKRLVIVLIHVVLVALMTPILTWALPVRAQGGSEDDPPPGATVHVVQRDENLFRIAMQYGTTVEAIAEANGISDPRYISVGQRLLIPNGTAGISAAEPVAAGALVTHILRPGDSLATLALRYHTTPQRIAAANGIINPARLFVGQSLAIKQGEPGPIPNQRAYLVQPDDNLLRIAARHATPLAALRAAQLISGPDVVFTGQRLWIPDGAASEAGAADDAGIALIDLPPPFEAVACGPLPAMQGKTFSITVTTRQAAEISGDFLGFPLRVVTSSDGQRHTALIGVQAFAPQGVFAINLSTRLPDGAESHARLLLPVIAGGYGAETIALEGEKEALLDQQVTEPEWQRVSTLMSQFTPERYFDGVMGLPSTGAITSGYGIRRTYNDGILATFHTGTDFGSAPGAAVVAPAAGIVLMAEELPVRGKTVIIDHGWGVTTGYFHQAEILVSVGTRVSAGQAIGTVGNTGRSTGPHLHWEMFVGGVQVDAMQWVQQAFP